MPTVINGSTGIDKVADGADMPAGSVVQHLYQKTSSLVTVSGTTATSLGCPVTITPKYANSRLHLHFTGHHSSDGDKTELHVYLNGTAITMPAQAGIWLFDKCSGSQTWNPETVSGTYEMTSSNTSSLTFDIRGKEHGGSAITFNGRNYNNGHFGSSLTVMEIVQ